MARGSIHLFDLIDDEIRDLMNCKSGHSHEKDVDAAGEEGRDPSGDLGTFPTSPLLLLSPPSN